MPTSVALGDHFETFVKSQVASGRFNNASEVVREGLRLLEDHEELRRLRLEQLRAEIARGLEGPAIPAEQVFDTVRARVRAAAPSDGAR